MVESSAAAMAYGLMVAGSKTALIFDIGGGTTDITILRIEGNSGSFTVLACGGNGSCGGRRMDTLILQHVLRCLLNDTKNNSVSVITLLDKQIKINCVVFY